MNKSYSEREERLRQVREQRNKELDERGAQIDAMLPILVVVLIVLMGVIYYI